MSEKNELISKLKQRREPVAVVGLGYVGLPFAVVLAEAGYEVIGIDLNPDKIARLNQGISYIQDIPDERLEAVVESGNLRATADYQEIEAVSAVSICVPTPLNKTGDPDLSYIVNAAGDMLPHLHPGMILILTSTTYPGSTREIVLPMLAEHDWLELGVNFFLAFSPERVDPGREDWTTYNTPRVVGGITPEGTEVGTAFLREALETVIPVSSAEVAEMSKLLENTFRMINIGLVNEMALMCDRLGVNVWEVIEAAATKPFGFMKFTPGPGLGGHCIPIDPIYLSWKLRSLQYHTRFIDLAAEINSNMPRFVIRQIQDALNLQEMPLKGSNILILGAAYKPDIDDLRESPALDVIDLLLGKGARVQFHDPHIPSIAHQGWELTRIEALKECISSADCVVVITDHGAYDYREIAEHAKCIVDTRNALGARGIQGEHIFPI